MRNSVLMFMLVFFAVKISPQSTNVKNNSKENNVKNSDLQYFADSLRADAILKLEEKIEADKIVEKNKGYIANLEKKIEKKALYNSSSKKNTSNKKANIIAKSDTKANNSKPKEIIYTEVSVPIQKCVELKGFFGRLLSKDNCKRYVTDSISVEIY